jgi:hypothetical protein
VDTLRIIYFGLSHDLSYDCAGSVRLSLVNNWQNLFATGCPTGDAQCTSGLDHAWRLSDLSADTSALVAILAPPGRGIGTLSTAAVHGRASNPFCNSHDAAFGTSSYADEGSPTTFAGLTFPTPSDFQDFDPIRRKSAPATSTTGDTVSRGKFGAANFAGALGLVLPIVVPGSVASTDLYDAPTCSTFCTLVGITKGSQIPTGYTCPDGTQPTLGACYMPVVSQVNPDPRCVSTTTARCFGVTGSPDGRAYNLVTAVDRTTIPPAQQSAYPFQFAQDANKRILSGSFFRIHQRTGSPNADITAGQTGVCKQLVDTDQVSCLASADPCTVGLSNSVSLKFFPPLTPAPNKQVYP